MTETCPTCGAERQRISLHFSQGPCGYPDLTERQRDMCRGLLMSDATIEMQSGNAHARMSIDMINEEFLEWVDNQLGWITTGVSEVPRDYSGNRQQQYRLRTRTHPFFDELYEWYDTGEKRWPSDLTLTPIMAKMWYVGDGTYHDSQSQSHIAFYAVNEEDRPEYVCGLLEEVGFDTTYQNHGQFSLDVQDSQDFLEWVGEAPPGFEYKWVDYTPQEDIYHKWQDENWLRKKYIDEAKTQTEVAEECDVQQATVSRWLIKHGIDTGPKGS